MELLLLGVWQALMCVLWYWREGLGHIFGRGEGDVLMRDCVECCASVASTSSR